MPTPLFTLAVPLIINQPCNYTAVQRVPASEKARKKGDGRVAREKMETSVRSNCWREVTEGVEKK